MSLPIFLPIPQFLLLTLSCVGNEACFYKAMGWAVKGKVDAAAIKADMAGLEEGVKNEFNSNIDTCTAWGGSFGRRRRRSVLDTESEKVSQGL